MHCAVEAGDLAVLIEFEITVVDGVENRAVTRFALRQAFEHLVEFAGQLSQLVVAVIAQAR
ncbi:hypothetical protein D3C84_1282820 [compost metagenome]